MAKKIFKKHFSKKSKTNFSQLPSISGKITFENTKILLHTESEVFFVIPKNLPKNLLSGDTVSAKIVKNAEDGRLAEVKILKLLQRTKNILLGFVKGKYIIPIANLGAFDKINIEKIYDKKFPENTLVQFEMEGNLAVQIEIFKTTEKDTQIASILFLNNISNEWSVEIQKQEKFLKNAFQNFLPTTKTVSENNILFDTKNLVSDTKINQNANWYEICQDDGEERISLKNWYTLTIDGADAKDLDDAISVARYENGDFLLGVHIADVSYFVSQKTPIDREALLRGTSVYLPDRVIPMLPETLSNDLCSLQPHREKFTLTCLMKIHAKTGKVLHTDIFSSIIQSRHRGVYEDIFQNFQMQNFEDEILKNTVNNAFSLFEILKARRKKEGKISFETTELYFDFDENGVNNIHKRIRNDAHKLIEECMVLANEEVAKWCTKRKIPFLSRAHPLPSEDAMNTIHTLIGNPKNRKNTDITPKEIENFLSKLSETELYFASRMILPKMSKAQYSYGKNGHFGLALDFYSHFTSPIRRYPDLITHRMIREYLAKKLDKNAWEKYAKNLTKIALESSNNEKRAENIENLVDKIFTARFMQSKIGEQFFGKISGVATWGIFVELENGVEVTVYLPRFSALQVDNEMWVLIDKNQKIHYKVGEEKNVKITKILETENRIVAEFIAENKNP